MAIKYGQSKVLTESGVISTAGKSARVWAITLLTGTTDTSLTLRDGGASGTIKWKISTNATAVAYDNSENVVFKTPIICTTDAYATVAGTNAYTYVLYDEIES